MILLGKRTGAGVKSKGVMFGSSCKTARKCAWKVDIWVITLDQQWGGQLDSWTLKKDERETRIGGASQTTGKLSVGSMETGKKKGETK